MMARVELAALNGRYNQMTWGRVSCPRDYDLVVDDHGEPVGTGTCGTARCAAGWALHDSPFKMVWMNVGETLYADFVEDGRDVPDAATGWLEIPVPDDTLHGDDYYFGYEGSDHRWNYEENMPHLFDAANSLEEVYEWVMSYLDDVTREQFDGIVMNTVVRLQSEAIEKRVSR